VDRGLERLYVLKGEAQDHGFKSEATEWELLRCRLHESRWAPSNVRFTNL
jgi:hypothetical protein